MSKPEVLIRAVTTQNLSYGEVAKRYNVSKTLVHRLHHRWLEEVSLRYGNKMLHLGIGRAHARTEIIVMIHNNDTTVITHDGTVLGEYELDTAQGYQPKRKNG